MQVCPSRYLYLPPRIRDGQPSISPSSTSRRVRGRRSCPRGRWGTRKGWEPLEIVRKAQAPRISLHRSEQVALGDSTLPMPMRTSPCTRLNKTEGKKPQLAQQRRWRGPRPAVPPRVLPPTDWPSAPAAAASPSARSCAHRAARGRGGRTPPSGSSAEHASSSRGCEGTSGAGPSP